MNRFVKVKGHTNWFLVLEPNQDEPVGLSESMKERIFRSQVCKLHDPKAKVDEVQRLIIAATRNIDYEDIALQSNKTLIIRPSGSYMFLSGNDITEEKISNNFPIDKTGDIVICENDEKADYSWLSYLKRRFPDKEIVTINFFDLRSDDEVKEYFDKAKLITFSTTFTSFDWFKKLTKHQTTQKVIGYCSDTSKWNEVVQINDTVEVVSDLK